MTVVVVIADRDAHSIVTVSRVSQTCSACDVRKASVAILAVKPVPIARIVDIVSRRPPQAFADLAAIPQKKIKQAAVDVAGEGHPARHSVAATCSGAGR